MSRAGHETFLPFERVKRRHRVGRNRYRLKTVDEPLFPRYVFGFAEVAVELLGLRGVLDVVRSGVDRCPIPVPDGVIEALRPLAGERGLLREWDSTALSHRLHLKVGDEFKFSSRAGSLAGLLGRVSDLSALDTTGQLKAWVTMFGGPREVDIDHRFVGTVQGKAPHQLQRPALGIAASVEGLAPAY